VLGFLVSNIDSSYVDFVGFLMVVWWWWLVLFGFLIKFMMLILWL